MDEGRIRGAGAGVAQDPADGGVDQQVEGVELRHVMDGLGKDAVKGAEDRGERVYGDVKRADMACDVGLSREERHDAEVA